MSFSEMKNTEGTDVESRRRDGQQDDSGVWFEGLDIRQLAVGYGNFWSSERNELKR